MTQPVQATPSPMLLIACGIVGLLGAIALVASNAIGSIVVPGHDWIADTVSDLGAGRYEIIQDVGLHAYAAGLLACAIGAAHYHIGGTRWTLGILCLALLAFCVEIIGVRNEYGDADDEGVVIHIYLVYALGVLFTAAPLLLAAGLAQMGRIYAIVSVGCAVLWGVGAPIFFLLPTTVDGVWERGLGIVTIVFVMMLSALLIRVGRAMRSGVEIIPRT